METPHELAQRSWSFPVTSGRCGLCWHNGVSRSQTNPAEGNACYFAEARSLLQLLGGDSAYLAKDSIVSLRSLGRATRRHRPLPPPTLLPELCVAPPWVPGESRAHLEPRAPWGLGREVAASPGAQLVARSLLDPLK